MRTRPGSSAAPASPTTPSSCAARVEDPAWFWPLAIDDMGLEFSRPWTQVLDDSRGPAWTTWFVGATLNDRRNCVHRWAGGGPTASPRSGSARTARAAS